MHYDSIILFTKRPPPWIQVDMLFQPFFCFGNNALSKKSPNWVQRWKHLRHFITLYNPYIYTDEDEEKGNDIEDKYD